MEVSESKVRVWQKEYIALRASQKSKVKSQKLTTTGFQLKPMS